MSLRIGWLSPFTNRSGVGTFSKAVTDAMPESYRGEALDVTVVAPLADGLYPTRHRFIDIAGTAADSRFYDLFDVVVCNIGNNIEHHRAIVDVLRTLPAVVVCHDYVYQHLLAALVYAGCEHFADYVALTARYGSAEALRVVRDSNLTGSGGLRYGPWDSEFVATEPLGAPLLQLGGALVVHSAFAERYARSCFDGPVLRLGLPHDMRPPVQPARTGLRLDARGRRVLVSFGHVQSTKCIDDVVRAFAASPRLRAEALYVISGFTGDPRYVADLRGLVEEHGLEPCMRFQLDLSDAELADLGGQADGFVNLRYPNTEGASASLIEQFCTGKPVVVLDSGCYAEVPDDAAIKVARPRDPEALREALERMLDDAEALAAIGRRGCAYARRIDTGSYVAGLLDFLQEQRPLLARRAALRSRRMIGLGAERTTAAANSRNGQGSRHGREKNGQEKDGQDAAWSARLATARTVFELLDRNALADDPELLLGLLPDQLADFTQAAILCEGRNPILSAALRTYFRDRRDGWMAARLLHVLRRAVLLGDAEAAAILPDLCRPGDLPFWEVVAALGYGPLAAALKIVFFRDGPSGFVAEPVPTPNGALERHQLAADLAGRSSGDLAAAPSDLDAVLAWLRRGSHAELEAALEPMAVGQSIGIGSREYARFLRLFGFLKVEEDHAWSGIEEGVIYLRPAQDARRIVLSGHALEETIEVEVSARTASGPDLGRSELPAGAHEIEIALPERPEGETGMLCLAIHNSGCRSPAELGLAGDPRLLGFCLRQVAVA